MFEQAVRLKLRFDTARGFLSVEDLWDLPLTHHQRTDTLNDIAKALNRELKESADEDFVNPTAKPNDRLKLAFDIVKHIIDVRLAENDAIRLTAERKEKKARLLELIARKQDDDLASKSIEELTAMVESL